MTMQNQDWIEARRLCVEARRLLQQALEQAQSANRWAISDILGGGLISTFVKHSRANSAQEYIDRARPKLRQLEKLMGQIGIGGSVQGSFAPGGFETFADFAFDDFFSALSTQSKISNMKYAIETTISKLYALEKRLR